MKYKILYDTIINKEHRSANEIIEFAKGTDSGYITRLLKMGVIEACGIAENTESKRGKKGKNTENNAPDSENNAPDSESAESKRADSENNAPDSESAESK